MANDKISLEWKKTANFWESCTPPARPSVGEIKIYQQAIDEKLKNHNKLNILILGSTPELRDLAGEYGDKVYLVSCDINIEMYLAMTSLLKNKLNDEVFICSNWTKMPLRTGFFDIIMGDGVVGNVSDDQIFLMHLKKLLKNDGVLVTRVPFIPKNLKQIPIDELLALFEKEPKNKYAESELFVALQHNTANIDRKITSMILCRKSMEKYFDPKTKKYSHPSKFITTLLNGQFLSSMLQTDKEWGYRDKIEYEKLFKNYFNIQKIQSDPLWTKAPYFNQYQENVLPIYFLTA